MFQASEANIYTIPPIWKRIVAEILDFMILFVLKVMITFVAVDAFDLIDLENYDLPVAFDLLSFNPVCNTANTVANIQIGWKVIL